MAWQTRALALRTVAGLADHAPEVMGHCLPTVVPQVRLCGQARQGGQARPGSPGRRCADTDNATRNQIVAPSHPVHRRMP